MTGTGTATLNAEIGQVTVQIAAVNNRGCRVSIRGDVRDLVLEDTLRRLVQGRLQRGSINVHIQLEAAATVSLDHERLVKAYRELSALAEEAGAPQPALSEALRFIGHSGEGDLAAWEPAIMEAVTAAVDDCVAMRVREGAALTDAFRAHHGELFAAKARLAELADQRPQAYAERLQQRLAEVLTDRADLTPEHLVRELAIYADRIDVTEELVRLDSHLSQLAEALASEESALGKRIEFLLQEIGREINTTGAKANDSELQKVVIQAKQVVESMKEQAANIL